MSGGAVNLSLLSRGVGQIKQNGHEKVDVKLEPEVSQLYFAVIYNDFNAFVLRDVDRQVSVLLSTMEVQLSWTEFHLWHVFCCRITSTTSIMSECTCRPCSRPSPPGTPRRWSCPRHTPHARGLCFSSARTMPTSKSLSNNIIVISRYGRKLFVVYENYYTETG